MSRSVGQHHGDLRRALIAAALELVAESDVAGVTLRAVARRAGVSAAAPYHHFADKDALLAAVARDGFDALSDVQRAALQGPGSARERLEELVKRYVLFALSHRTHYGLMFRTIPTEVAGAEGEALRDVRCPHRPTRRSHTGGEPLTVDDAAGRAILAWSLAHGAVDVASWGQALRPGLDAEALAEDAGRAAGQLAVGN